MNDKVFLVMLFRHIYFWLIMALPVTAATNFTVATFNVENYFLSPYETLKKKAEVSRENLLLVGDLNDSPANDPIRALIGRGALKLLDLRPLS